MDTESPGTTPVEAESPQTLETFEGHLQARNPPAALAGRENLWSRTQTCLSASFHSSQSSNRFAQRRRQVAYHCLRSACAFYFTWIPITLVRILQTIEHAPVNGLLLMAALTTPMLGLPNFFVYLYPQNIAHQKDRQANPSPKRERGEESNDTRASDPSMTPSRSPKQVKTMVEASDELRNNSLPFKAPFPT